MSDHPSQARSTQFVVGDTDEPRQGTIERRLFPERDDGVMRDERLRLFEHALTNANVGVLIADATQPDLPIIFANNAVTRITGYSPEEILGRNCRFLQGTDRAQTGLQIIRTALRERQTCNVVLRNYKKDGTMFWNEVRISPVLGIAGQVTHFIGFQNDITAQKDAEATLAQHDAILAAVNRATESLLKSDDYRGAAPLAIADIGTAAGADNVCIWRHDTSTSPRTLNLFYVWSKPGMLVPGSALTKIAWEEYLGWPSSEVLRSGRTLQGGLNDCTPEEQQLVRSLDLGSFLCLPIFDSPGRLWGLLSIGCRAMGVVWSTMQVEALLSAARVFGAILQTQATTHAYHMANAALRQSEGKYRNLVTSLKEVVFQTNASGDWTFLNPAWKEITGFPVESTVGRCFLDYVHSDDRQRNLDLFQPLMERRKDYCRHEVRYLTKDGGFRWIEVFARLTLDDNGRAIGTAGTLSDITDRKEAEAQIQQSLREKEVMLKEIHHRVKNNLQIVSSLLNLQLEHVQDENTRALFMDAQSRIASMSLVHEKLYQSRDFGNIDFGEYVRDLVDNVIGAHANRGREIVLELQAEHLYLGIDTAIPCGLLINELVTNACKHAFGDHRTGNIKLSLHRTGHSSLRVEVSDDGCGIPDGLDLNQTRSLGMQLVQTLVHQLHGTMEVRRQPGARFVIDLQEAPRKKLVQ